MKSAKRVQVNRGNPDEDVLREAAEVIRSGGLVIIPTETVYGIAANMLNKKAIERLARIKERPKEKPFSLHIYKRETVEEAGAELSVVACKLMDAFWPGPLTLIFKRRKEPSIGIRMPDDEVAFKIIARSQVPVVCPSANRAGRPAPVTFTDAIRDLGELVDLAIDAGETRLKIESSVVDVTEGGVRIVREGAIPRGQIEAVASRKHVLFICTGNSCRSVMAEALLKKKLAEKNRTDVEVFSAGIMMMSGLGASEQTILALQREGVDVSSHQSQRVTAEIIASSDLILVMEKLHEERILQLVPDAKNRVFLLKEFAKISDNSLDIEDPVGKDAEFYAKTIATIREAIDRVVGII